MWHLHNDRILEHAEAANIPIWIVDYNNVLIEARYLQEVGATFRFFGFDLTTSELLDLRSKAVRTNINHNPEHVKNYPPQVQALWDELRQRHADQFA